MAEVRSRGLRTPLFTFGHWEALEYNHSISYHAYWPFSSFSSYFLYTLGIYSRKNDFFVVYKTFLRRKER